MKVPVLFEDVDFQMSIPTPDLFDSYPGGNLQSYVLKNKVWAEDETKIMSTILNLKKGLVLDVGANTGYFSFIALSKGCPVIAFEPNTIHTPYFMETMALNNFPMDKLTHHELFVSSTKSDIMFDGWSAYEGIVNENNTQSTKTIAIKDVCDECLFLKIDVEGYEPDVIKSAKPLLEKEKIPYIMFEVTYIVSDKVDAEQVNILHSLLMYNYDIFEIQTDMLIPIKSIKNKINKWSDEYFNHHKKHNPLIRNAGSNLLAIHKSAKNPFKKLDGSENYIL